MKVVITDIPTSIEIFKKCGFHDKPCETKYEWQGRCDKLTNEQILKGKSKNSEAKIFDAREFAEMYNDEDVIQEDGYSVRLWPTTESLGLFMHFQFPAYEVIPDGFTGTLIEVNIEDED